MRYDLPRLERQDIEERRPCCDHCGYPLTVSEIFTTKNRCVFHAKEGVDKLKRLTHYRFIKLLLGDLDVARGKLSMKAKGLTEVDQAACVGHTGKDLPELDAAGLKKLTQYMRRHKGNYAIN